MTMILFDGFDRYSAIGEVADYGIPWVRFGTVSLTTDTPRGAGNSITFNSGGISALTDDFGGTTVIAGGAFKCINDSGSAHNYFFAASTTSSASSTVQISLRRNITSNLLEVTRNFNIVLATGTSLISEDAWNFVEFKFNIHSSTGLFEVKLNGVTEIAEQTTQNTQGQAGNTTTYFKTGVDGSEDDFVVDDLYFLDTTSTPNNTYIGPCNIKMLDATGDNSVAWSATGTGTTNSDRIDDANPHDSDTTYVSSNTTTQKDLYDLANSAAGEVIESVKLVTVAKKTDAGARSLDTIISVSATEQTNTKALAESYTAYADYFDTSDGGTTEWTKTTLDSALIGVELTV